MEGEGTKSSLFLYALNCGLGTFNPLNSENCSIVIKAYSFEASDHFEANTCLYMSSMLPCKCFKTLSFL